MAFTYLEVKSAKFLCLLPVVLVLGDDNALCSLARSAITATSCVYVYTPSEGLLAKVLCFNVEPYM